MSFQAPGTPRPASRSPDGVDQLQACDWLQDVIRREPGWIGHRGTRLSRPIASGLHVIGSNGHGGEDSAHLPETYADRRVSVTPVASFLTLDKSYYYIVFVLLASAPFLHLFTPHLTKPPANTQSAIKSSARAVKNVELTSRPPPRRSFIAHGLLAGFTELPRPFPPLHVLQPTINPLQSPHQSHRGLSILHHQTSRISTICAQHQRAYIHSYRAHHRHTTTR